jgi:hypothetical protein
MRGGGTATQLTANHLAPRCHVHRGHARYNTLVTWDETYATFD